MQMEGWEGVKPSCRMLRAHDICFSVPLQLEWRAQPSSLEPSLLVNGSSFKHFSKHAGLQHLWR